jgi:MoxR-like ATPase
MTGKISALRENLRKVILGKNDTIEMLLTALFAGGSVLMEDVPGVGKTTLAKALAQSIDGGFHRVQFTPDLLPSDILGASVYNPKTGDFHFRKGPVFANILLSDEINRASPRTQSALLEAMNEGQVTIEGVTYQLPKPFLVIATENPVEYYGAYPLPEAQLDRFAMRLSIGYPDREKEIEILYSRKTEDPLENISPVMACADITDAQRTAREIDVEKSAAGYAADIVRGIREDSRVRLGASPRAFICLVRCAQSRAFLAGEKCVTPDDIKKLSPDVLAHRIIIDSKEKHSGLTASALVADVVDKIKVPR